MDNLIVEILLSKLWSAILNGPDFTELFLTRSTALPRLQRAGKWRFFSLPESQNPYRVLGEVLDSIPYDIKLEIYSRLPAESVARFRLVSKQWGDLLRHQDFTELFLTRSRARPRLFFCLEVYRPKAWNEWSFSFYSSPQPQNPHQNSSYNLRFHMKLSRHMWPHFCGLTSGLILFCRKMFLEKGTFKFPVVCNPSTGQFAILPTTRCVYSDSFGFLGFDPVDKQFKVLFVAPTSSNGHDILTLRTGGELRWEIVQCPFNHYPCSEGICINGVLYYSAGTKLCNAANTYGIVCFDVRFETFKFVAAECPHDKLINYKGKLGGIKTKYTENGGAIELSLWVLQDVDKQEWSKYVYTLRLWDENTDIFDVVGMTTRGEIVLSVKYSCKPFYVLYFNPERNTLQRFEIQGLGEQHEASDNDNDRVYTFVDYVEDVVSITGAKQLEFIQDLIKYN